MQIKKEATAVFVFDEILNKALLKFIRKTDN